MLYRCLFCKLGQQCIPWQEDLKQSFPAPNSGGTAKCCVAPDQTLFPRICSVLIPNSSGYITGRRLRNGPSRCITRSPVTQWASPVIPLVLALVLALSLFLQLLLPTSQTSMCCPLNSIFITCLLCKGPTGYVYVTG